MGAREVVEVALCSNVEKAAPAGLPTRAGRGDEGLTGGWVGSTFIGTLNLTEYSSVSLNGRW